MLLENALRAYLLTWSSITDLVGAGEAARLFPVILPQGAKMPAITYQGVSTVRDRGMTKPNGQVFRRLQLDVRAATYNEAHAVKKAIVDVIDGFRGYWDRVPVQGCEVENDRDDYESDVKLYRVGFDVAVWFDERAPD